MGGWYHSTIAAPSWLGPRGRRSTEPSPREGGLLAVERHRGVLLQTRAHPLLTPATLIRSDRRGGDQPLLVQGMQGGHIHVVRPTLFVVGQSSEQHGCHLITPGGSRLQVLRDRRSGHHLLQVLVHEPSGLTTLGYRLGPVIAVYPLQPAFLDDVGQGGHQTASLSVV